MPNIIEENDRCRVNFRHPDTGRQIRRTFSFRKHRGREGAIAAAQKLIDDVFGKGIDLGAVTLNQAIKLFNESQAASGALSETTIATDRNRLQVFRRWLYGSWPEVKLPQDLSPRIVAGFQAKIMNSDRLYADGRSRPAGNRANTWRRYKDLISKFLDFCVDEQLAEENFVRGNKRFRVKVMRKVRDRLYSAGELRQIFEQLADEPMVRAMFAVLRFTGCRLSEAMNLKWAQVNIPGRTIKIFGTKTKRERLVPMHRELATVLNELPERKRGYVVSDEKGDKLYLAKDRWSRIWRATIDALDLEPGRLMDLRHTAASEMLAAGVDVKTVADILGNSPKVVLDTYAHVISADHKRSAIDRLQG